MSVENVFDKHFVKVRDTWYLAFSNPDKNDALRFAADAHSRMKRGQRWLLRVLLKTVRCLQAFRTGHTSFFAAAPRRTHRSADT